MIRKGPVFWSSVINGEHPGRQPKYEFCMTLYYEPWRS